jgi:hypothetical protein
MIRRIALAFAAVFLLMLVVAAAGIFWPSAAAPVPDGPRDYVLRNVRIVDVERGLVGEPTSVRISDGLIAGLAPGAAEASIPIFDGGGGYLLPGFWDMHAHTFQVSPQMHLPLFVANGVTSLRDMMDCPGESDTLIACAADKRAWNSAAEAGRMASPRIVSVASYYFENPELTPAEVSTRARAAAARGLDRSRSTIAFPAALTRRWPPKRDDRGCGLSVIFPRR